MMNRANDYPKLRTCPSRWLQRGEENNKKKKKTKIQPRSCCQETVRSADLSPKTLTHTHIHNMLIQILWFSLVLLNHHHHIQPLVVKCRFHPSVVRRDTVTALASFDRDREEQAHLFITLYPGFRSPSP